MYPERILELLSRAGAITEAMEGGRGVAPKKIGQN